MERCSNRLDRVHSFEVVFLLKQGFTGNGSTFNFNPALVGCIRTGCWQTVSLSGSDCDCLSITPKVASGRISGGLHQVQHLLPAVPAPTGQQGCVVAHLGVVYQGTSKHPNGFIRNSWRFDAVFTQLICHTTGLLGHIHLKACNTPVSFGTSAPS